MFIELTDHLRCPADHDESYLVLLPEVTDGRSVRSGTLGCPVCQAEYRIEDGVVRFAPRPGVAAPDATISGAALHALLGLAGPGGYAALVGDVTAQAPALAHSDPGVHFAAVRPVAGLAESRELSLIDADLLPFKRGSLRGVVLGAGYGGDARWVADAVRAVLPGLRVVGAGAAPAGDGLELQAEADGWWVGRKKGK
ncbi:MAG TPA: hypothetical protein VFI39_11510 [Gemmatimonadales bacterium]|nr:hypothetical protein [Gemmatimonadales bacterium]